MYTLESLMNKTPEEVIERSRFVQATVKNKKNTKKKDLNTLQFIVTCTAKTPYTEGGKKKQTVETYDVVIEFYPTELKKDVYAYPSVKAPVFVYCSCPYFFYYNMYALARVGSTHLTDEHNAKKAEIKNPNNIAYLCKHLYKAAPLCVTTAKQNASSAAGKYQFKNI